MDMDVIMRSHNCPNIVRCYGCFVFEVIHVNDKKILATLRQNCFTQRRNFSPMMSEIRTINSSFTV